MYVEIGDHLFIPASNHVMYSTFGSQLPWKLNTMEQKAPTE